MSRSPARAISNDKQLYFEWQHKSSALRKFLHLREPGAFIFAWLNKQPRSFQALAVLNLVLGIGVAAELGMIAWQGGTAAVYSPAAAPSVDAVRYIVPDDRPQASVDRWESLALARPLFSPSRLPPVVVSNIVEKPPQLPRLSGILLSANKRIGIFYNADDSPIIVTEGSSLGAFKVLSISSNSLLVSGPAGIQTIYPNNGSGQISAKYAAASTLPSTDNTAEFDDSNSWPLQ